MRKATDRQGFTLLELVVVVTIIATLAGAAVPVTSKMLNHRHEQATIEELHLLAEACSGYFVDTGELPGELVDLLVDPGRPGWVGPYLTGVVPDRSGSSGYLVDGWSRAYRWRVDGDVATIASAGRDAEFDGEADLEVPIDVTPLRRAETVDRLTVINAAVRSYNEHHLATAPLSGDWSQAFEQLVAAGLLPADDVYRQDAWGDVFVARPAGRLPVVAIDTIRRTTTDEPAGELPESGRRGRGGAKSWPRRDPAGR